MYVCSIFSLKLTQKGAFSIEWSCPLHDLTIFIDWWWLKTHQKKLYTLYLTSLLCNDTFHDRKRESISFLTLWLLSCSSSSLLLHRFECVYAFTDDFTSAFNWIRKSVGRKKAKAWKKEQSKWDKETTNQTIFGSCLPVKHKKCAPLPQPINITINSSFERNKPLLCVSHF